MTAVNVYVEPKAVHVVTDSAVCCGDKLVGTSIKAAHFADSGILLAHSGNEWAFFEMQKYLTVGQFPRGVDDAIRFAPGFAAAIQRTHEQGVIDKGGDPLAVNAKGFYAAGNEYFLAGWSDAQGKMICYVLSSHSGFDPVQIEDKEARICPPVESITPPKRWKLPDDLATVARAQYAEDQAEGHEFIGGELLYYHLTRHALTVRKVGKLPGADAMMATLRERAADSPIYWA